MPLEIARSSTADVRIRWSDGHDTVYPAPYLRRHCPCAVCQTRVPAQDADLQPRAISAVGGYAIQIEWSDGHATGVYSFAYLRGLCPCPSCVKQRQA